MNEAKSILEMAQGAIMEQVNVEVSRIVDNILDPNTDAKKNPIRKLKPYRTFNEVDQPESEFLLRLSEGGGVALYEADGGAWKLQARRNVAEYLKNALANLVEAGEVIIVE